MKTATTLVNGQPRSVPILTMEHMTALGMILQGKAPTGKESAVQDLIRLGWVKRSGAIH